MKKFLSLLAVSLTTVMPIAAQTTIQGLEKQAVEIISKMTLRRKFRK